MKSNVWLTISWLDYQLKWDPREYDGIKVPNLTGFTTLSEQLYTFWTCMLVGSYRYIIDI